ncbi:SDR family NAD(P)-dependent oxidoreductase [Spirosoma montaniterrae]|uniref:Short-chain dehydrogenase n=1 Tax=Spirosoma montaniterrae TaxID=1178516 RepID=A0A1P9WUX9_9BACT|nr:SDR family NAD(P)-dependent oxidoreductase [Spirosoma montaniterrae]AQG79187.1 short-chain dehydrogenase [Spirosoma montaniterrae]
MTVTDAFSLRGKNALVTGSTQGIGRAIALTLAEHGANVLIHGRDEAEAGQDVVDDIRSRGVRSDLILVDLLDADAARAIYDTAQRQLGAIDTLVINASVQLRKPWTDVSPADFVEQTTVNWQRTLELVQAFAPTMQQRRWGRILTIGSVQQTKPHPQMIAYAASKAAVVNMVRNLAVQLAPDGITVNNLAPGVILTDRNADALADATYREQVRSRIPAGYFGEPTDCAGLALLLCSEAGRYVTGQDIFIDGGMSL